MVLTIQKTFNDYYEIYEQNIYYNFFFRISRLYFTHRIILLLWTRADDHTVVRPRDLLRGRYGCCGAFHADGVANGSELGQFGGDDGSPFDEHRRLGEHFAESRGGCLAVVSARGRLGHVNGQVGVGADHLWGHGNRNRVSGHRESKHYIGVVGFATRSIRSIQRVSRYISHTSFEKIELSEMNLP